MAERFAAVDIGNMHFDKRYGHTGQRIADGDTGVRISTRIDDDCIYAFIAGGMDAVYQPAFAVTLKTLHRDTAPRRRFNQAAFYIGQRVRTINLRFARTEQIEIGTVD